MTRQTAERFPASPTCSPLWKEGTGSLIGVNRTAPESRRSFCRERTADRPANIKGVFSKNQPRGSNVLQRSAVSSGNRARSFLGFFIRKRIKKKRYGRRVQKNGSLQRSILLAPNTNVEFQLDGYWSAARWNINAAISLQDESRKSLQSCSIYQKT